MCWKTVLWRIWGIKVCGILGNEVGLLVIISRSGWTEVLLMICGIKRFHSIGFRISRILSPTIAQLLWIQMMVFLVVVSGTFGLKRLGYWRIVVNERSLDFGEFRLEVFWKDLILSVKG